MLFSRLWSLLGLVVAVAANEATLRYDVVCDAGSTGTRMYLFTSTFFKDADGKEQMNISSEVIGKKKPGLSEYKDKPKKAGPPLLKLFEKVKDKVPQEQWAHTTVSVMSTGGMRALRQEDRPPIFDAVRQALVESDSYVFSKKKSMLEIRQLSGFEEGSFGMLAVNFLTGRLDHKMHVTDKGSKEHLVGMLDLGGSSTQVAVAGHPAIAGKVYNSQSESKVRSYSAYGMEQMRSKVTKHIGAKGVTSSPCDFKGYRDPSTDLVGSGDASECRKILLEVWADSKKECTRHGRSAPVQCMPGIDEIAGQAGTKGMQFFAVSGYLFVTDFTGHWLQRKETAASKKLKAAGNRPTMEELEAGADELCASDWAEIERITAGGAAAGAHRYTDSEKAPHRCLEVNYVTTLLRHYGFPRDQRFVTFADEVDEIEAEWPLGALLQTRFDRANADGSRSEL